MARGYVALLLHAHLPFIRHPEHDSFLEESWLFEAITETYIPLLEVCRRLLDDGVRFRLTLSLSPTLVAMLRDRLLQQRYLRHLERLHSLAEREIRRTRTDTRLAPLARMYRDLFATTRRLFTEDYRSDLPAAFGALEDAGVLQLLTSAATHGYLPLLRVEPSSVRAQVQVAALAHQSQFGRPARGIWLPECGYYPGLENLVQAAGFRYFVVDTHGILNASLRPHYGIWAPLACPNGVAAFGRDPESSQQVWSAESGYPGDPAYREFYRDAGFELALDDLRPFVSDDQCRLPTGLKYYRITGTSPYKEPYEPARARERVQVQADDFVQRRVARLSAQALDMDRPPLALAPYDAELFGHWWFEGPLWLEAVIRGLARHADTVEMLTPGDYLERYPVLQVATPSPSSWGERGYNEFWLNEGNDWIYPHLHHAARFMRDAARDHHGEPAGTLVHRALQQAARSLLLAQGSDWAFIMKTGTAVEYAYRRIRDHLARFHYLEVSLREQRVDERRLRALELMDNIFPDIDYRVFA